jgi:hypothetical protein
MNTGDRRIKTADSPYEGYKRLALISGNDGVPGAVMACQHFQQLTGPVPYPSRS